MKTDDELIAEFMGYTVTPITDLTGYYQKSWDNLMPVYNELTSRLDIAWKITSKGVHIHNHGGGFEGKWEINCPEAVIIDAYRAIVGFIKWYNEQSTHTTHDTTTR